MNRARIAVFGAALAVALAGKARAEGPEETELVGHKEYVTGLAWSPDGKWLASSSYDKKIIVWDAASGTMQAKMGDHEQQALCLAWSPDSTKIVSGDHAHQVWVWDVGRRKVLKELAGHDDSVVGVAWSNDGTKIASAGSDGFVKIWDVNTWSESKRWRLGKDLEAATVSFSPDGTKLFAGDLVGGGYVYTSDTYQRIFLLRGHSSELRYSSFSRDGKTLATASADGTVRLWDMESGKTIRTLPVGDKECWGVSYRPDGKWIATGCRDGSVKIWEAASGKIVYDFDDYKKEVDTVAWSNDGKILAAGCRDSSIHLYWFERARVPPVRPDPPPRHDPPPPPEPPKPDKKDIAKKQIADIEVALRSFDRDNGYLPHSVNSGLVTALSGGRRGGGYYRFNRDELNAKNEVIDAWGNPLLYRSPGSKGALFDLYSAGPNGKDDCGTGDDVGSW